MHSRRLRFQPLADAEDVGTVPGRGRRDVFAWAAITAIGIAILVNALFLQSGPHPAPIFANKPMPAASPERTGSLQLPRPRPADPEPVKPQAPQRLRAEIVTDIQRELIRRGFYDGPADGVYGAKTDAAIRDFEHLASLKPSTEPSETLLRAILQSTIKSRRGADAPRSDPIADLIAPPKRVIAVQRVLAAFGYGQINPNGVLGPETQAAIQKFERQRKLPVTGQVTDALVRELATMTGRPLE